MSVAADPAAVVPIGVTNALVVSTCVLALLFCAYYWVKMPWWKTQMGWNLFTMSACLGLFTLPSTIGIIFGLDFETSAAFQWFVIACFSIVPLAEAHRIYILWRAPSSRDQIEPPEKILSR